MKDTSFSDLFSTWKNGVDNKETVTVENWEILQKCYDKICCDDYQFSDSEQIRDLFLEYGKLKKVSICVCI